MKPIIPVMRQALEAIQREHEVDFSWQSLTGQDLCVKCPEEDGWPCATRKLADEGLTDHTAREMRAEK